MNGKLIRTLPPILAMAMGLSTSRAIWAQHNESYFFATGAINDGPSNFVDKWCGPDMLPYTADDIALPENGNYGGTWGFSWIDLNGDGQLQDAERIFTLIRRDDDDIYSYVPEGFPKYGVLKEGENFVDMHEARNNGPSHDGSACDPAEFPGCLGDDFEHNDRGGIFNGVGQPGFEGAQNFLWYNNDRADQRGWGGSKYYFALENGSGLDEMEGFVHWCTFQNNNDDPDTADFDETGPCKREWMRSPDLSIKGILIPVDEIAGLKDGDLDPLFGWYSGDMAKYVRDTLGPKLSDAALNTTANDEDCARSETAVTPTHLMILQMECPIKINGDGSCGDQTQAEAMAAYWGIAPINPGAPETDAVYRACNILLFNDGLTQVGGGTPNFITQPTDGVKRNLWVQDSFFRNDKNRLGRYTFGPDPTDLHPAPFWSIQDDSSADAGCGTTDHLLQLDPGVAGFFEAPLDAKLNPASGSVLAIAEVGSRVLAVPAAPQGGGIQDSDLKFQIILMSGANVLAYAQVDSSDSSVNTGGSIGADGLATGFTDTAKGPGGEIPDVDPLVQSPTLFTRFVLKVDASSIQLLQAEGVDYDPTDYEDMEGYTALATLAKGISSNVTAVRWTASAGSELGTAVFDGVAVFQNLGAAGGRQKPVDANQDGGLDLSDPVSILNYLFLGTNPRLPCGDGTSSDAANLALIDANNDGQIDLSDPVFVLSFLFLGGPAPAQCAGDPGCPCITIPGCPDNANCQ